MTAMPHKLSDTRAEQVYQTWLDTASAAIMNGDAAGFAKGISLPYMLRTATSETLLEHSYEVESDAQHVTNWLHAQGATHYIRLVRKAHFLNENIVEGWHTTHALRNALSLLAPYNNRMVMRRDGETWRVIEAEHELSNQTVPIDLIRSAPGAMSERWADRISDIRMLHSDALPLYQAYLDALGEAERSRSAAAWLRFFTFPYDVHYDNFDHVVTDADDATDFFTLLMEKFDEHGGGLTRTATHAQFIAADQICGYHSAVIESNGKITFGPVQSRMIVKLDDNAWRCRSVTNSLSNEAFPGPDFLASQGLPTAREIQKRTKK